MVQLVLLLFYLVIGLGFNETLIYKCSVKKRVHAFDFNCRKLSFNFLKPHSTQNNKDLEMFFN